LDDLFYAITHSSRIISMHVADGKYLTCNTGCWSYPTGRKLHRKTERYSYWTHIPIL